MTQADRNTTIMPSVAVLLITAGLLTVVKLMAPYEMLLADRFVPGAGWVQIVALSLYGALLVRLMLISADTSIVRIRIWLAFSIVFFTQFILGVAGIDKLLMTGNLHIPLPAVVVAGPLFRGERFFMPILFLSTIVLVGPAWCSHLCYIGGWDGLSARAKKRPAKLPRAWRYVRLSIFILTPSLALLFRYAGVPGMTAAYVAIAFGVVSLGVMALVSTRTGVMVHCTSICPLGLLGNVLGKISPFRFRIGAGCTDCGRCAAACRYDALSPAQISARRPGNTCTLCGDCLSACRDGALGYRFLSLSPHASRILFLVIIVSLHAVFLGVARI
jgi:polyferredoxin